LRVVLCTEPISEFRGRIADAGYNGGYPTRTAPLMKEFLDLYLETGMIGVVGAMFVYCVVGLARKADGQQKSLERLQVESSRQSDALKNTESITIKLIDRWDQSDAVRDRRHEEVVRELHGLRADVNYLRGRMDGK